MFNTYPDGSLSVVEAARNRNTYVNLGGLGIVFSRSSQMSIVINADETVQIIARDFHVGG